MRLRPRALPPLAVLALAAALAPTRAAAGIYASPSVRWSSFALRPVEGEPTPNYYGFGASVALGYSVAQILDVGAFYTQVPGRLESAALMGHDASLADYGADVALRLGDSVVLDFRGGRAHYVLRRQKRPEELPGKWTGPAGAVAIGAVSRMGKQSFFQTSLEVLHTVLENDDGGSAPMGKRRLDAFALSFAYVYSAHQTFRFEDTIFRDFLDGMTFF